ncbi:RAP protein, putative [Plasmodium knowlesi strain H]|uniref:RAP protein, putative n=3 Tax=Plasmodium knowlesi TaxID=5850 RepID=A0A5K1VHF7_PLAKH|nr:RAP protein, putative [Plasmodium knowlesi strain H]OTN65687.1 putative RAP protein [Plasmodium knowlesi]CAA9989613.1 RAP protein, putative [Plasmodium knowlesi strain H]SBO22690.1 RAP protein, putative [Plasmodium knowlesi strain H]SBO23266.1 RAP protein, putative [Plasmodium knowlesi strain H]VVS79087.1 RAP protein, putative [Plasmodium knowlesi strain H]|eukprot:XP_002260339.1 RAP protein, putative [Plasmodium knowlesi strain H]
MLRGGGLTRKVLKIGKRWLADKECAFFTTENKNKGTKNALSICIEINKAILKNEYIFEIVKIIKKNEKNANIINYVTFVHRLMQIIYCRKDDPSYLKSITYIHDEIEEKINIIFQYLIDHKKSVKVNNYNKRLFSSFIWSLSKYASLFQGGDTRHLFASTVPHSHLAHPCKGEVEWMKRVLVLNGQGENVRGVDNVYLSEQEDDDGDRMGRSIPPHTTTGQGELKRHDGKNRPHEEVRGSLTPCNKFNLLCYYADAYLPSLNPSRYVLVLWSLSKLNKHFKELHEKYYERSTSLLPMLKSKEVIMLLYSYSYVNYSNLHFYVKVKDFIMSKKIYKQIVRSREYESVINMLLSFSRQNVFPQNLLESTVDQILHSKDFLELIKSKDLVTLLFCLCKFPFLYTPFGNPVGALKRRETNIWARKNIFLYELLKKEIMNRCTKGKNPSKDTFQREERNTNKEVPVYKMTYSLENLILIIWSLSLKYMYSAKLFLCCFTKLSDLLKNQNYLNSSYPMLTNFYLSLLAFLLEDGKMINLYFNRAELNSLRILHDNVGNFERYFGTFKKAINMNGRKYDVEVSGMHKVIYNLVSNLFKGSENVAVILEHKNVVHLSVDILLLQKVDTTRKKNEHRRVAPRTEFLCEDSLPHDRNGNEQAYHSNRGDVANCAPYASGKRNTAICSPFPIPSKSRSIGVHQKRDCHSSTENDNIKSRTYVEKVLNTSTPSEKTDICNDEVKSSLLRFIGGIKNANDKMDEKKLKEIFKDVLTFFGKYSPHINEQDMVSFFYKFSALFPRLCELRDRGILANGGDDDFLRIFSHFHGYTTNKFFQSVNGNKTHYLLDVCWVYFRYMKYFCALSKDGNSYGPRDKESITGMSNKKRLSGEIQKIVKIFDHVVMNRMISEQMIEKMSSKNMAHLISIFFHINNSTMIEYLKKNNFHNVHFTVKDILLILSALAKSDFEWKIEASYFCNKFIQHIDTCGVRDLVEFTYLCAELKHSNELISTHIKDKINSCCSLQQFAKQSYVERRSDSYGGVLDVSSIPSGQTTFIETFEQDELAFFVRNCYRMHCFDRHFFDTLCDAALRRRNTLSAKNLCIVLPCFARVYCLYGVGAYFPSGRSGGREPLTRSDHADQAVQLAHTSDHLDADMSFCRYDAPASLKKLAKYAETEILLSRNPNLFNLAYLMEAFTLLKVENKRAYALCVKEVERKVGMNVRIGTTNEREKKRHTWGDTNKEVKLLGKILWCMSYYHKTEFTLAKKITNFLLTKRIYQIVIPENFISIFLYYIKSRVYNISLFHKMGQAVTRNITLQGYFIGEEGKRRGGFKLSVITELFGTMAWAYAFTCSYPQEAENRINRGENKRQKSEIKNDQLFLNKIYTFLLKEIKILHKYKGVSFLLLARYLWGIAIVNLVNEEVIQFINAYNWNAVNIREQNYMHLHMIFTFWLRLKYSHHGYDLSEDFLSLKDHIISQLGKKKKKLKNGHHTASQNISDFHQQVCQVLDKFGVKYENEYMAQELLSIDLAIRDDTTGEKIAVEVDGPSHHLVLLDETDMRDKKMYAACGTTHFKNWLLREMGWTVINIQAHVWNKLGKEEKDAYVVGKLTNCSDSLKRHFAKWDSPN